MSNTITFEEYMPIPTAEADKEYKESARESLDVTNLKTLNINVTTGGTVTTSTVYPKMSNEDWTITPPESTVYNEIVVKGIKTKEGELNTEGTQYTQGYVYTDSQPTSNDNTSDSILVSGSTFSNTPTGTTTYKDLSNISQSLALNDGVFYINKGYTDNVSIPLSKLMPTGSVDVTAKALLSNITAYDASGKKITGTMQNNSGAEDAHITINPDYANKQITVIVDKGYHGSPISSEASENATKTVTMAGELKSPEIETTTEPKIKITQGGSWQSSSEATPNYIQFTKNNGTVKAISAVQTPGVLSATDTKDKTGEVATSIETTEQITLKDDRIYLPTGTLEIPAGSPKIRFDTNTNKLYTIPELNFEAGFISQKPACEEVDVTDSLYESITTRPNIKSQSINVVGYKKNIIQPIYLNVYTETQMEKIKATEAYVGRMYRYVGDTTETYHSGSLYILSSLNHFDIYNPPFTTETTTAIPNIAQQSIDVKNYAYIQIESLVASVSTPEELEEQLKEESEGRLFKYTGDSGTKYTQNHYYLVEKNIPNYLYFELISSESASIKPTGKLEISYTGAEPWTKVEANVAGINLTTSNPKVYIRCTEDNTPYKHTSDVAGFILDGTNTTTKIKCGGNIMSLISQDCTSLEIPQPTGNQEIFQNLFLNCSWLISGPDLPATALQANCYKNMFKNCSNLATCYNTLPATTLLESCYESMFEDCTSLKIPPNIKATILAESCCKNMFKDCSELLFSFDLVSETVSKYAYLGMFENCIQMSTLPKIEATSVDEGSMMYMFKGCTHISRGHTLNLKATTIAKEAYCSMFEGCTGLLTAPTLSSSTSSVGEKAMQSMFMGCSSLTQVPTLTATTLAVSCYESMFSDCKSLTTVPELSATIMQESCYKAMFKNCLLITKTPVLSAPTLAISCYESMFSGCESLTTAPELPAITMTQSCYKSMFSGCKLLSNSPKLLATTLADSCYESMFNDCTLLTTVSSLPAKTLTDNCYKAMFSGCSSLNVYDSYVSEYIYPWTIPQYGNITETKKQTDMFLGCSGSRKSNDLSGEAEHNYTYYTQNTPV